MPKTARDYLQRGYHYRTQRHCAPAVNRATRSLKNPSAKPPSPYVADRDSNVREVLDVATKVSSMADREVRLRYHELVDKQLAGPLTAMERFELERIELRLDAEDRDPEIEARDRQWELERTQLLDSIEDLLVRLRK
jgi:hypothetical protein